MEIKDTAKTTEEKQLEERVEMQRITLVDSTDEAYDFLILDELEYHGNTYLALVSCDEKTDTGNEYDPGEANDVTIVRVGGSGQEKTLFAVTDAEELYAVGKMVEERFGHLSEA
ncbi:MAG: DUF1292 domain-containing protein [Brotaphodocola sp.]